MRADTHAGPELRLHTEAEYIDAALTFVTLPTSCDARPDHTLWHWRCLRHRAYRNPIRLYIVEILTKWCRSKPAESDMKS